MVEQVLNVLPQLISVGISLIALVVSSALMLISFVIAKQNWIKSRQVTTTVLLLPIITFGITTVIKGNISLSLGLVGALSIVRFRNPVKSPLELTAMFAAISFGIMATQNIQWPLFMSAGISGVIIGIHFLDIGTKNFLNKNLLSYSFAEAGNQYSLEILGFSESLIGELRAIDNDIAINAVITDDESENRCFISTENRATIDKFYEFTKGKAVTRTLNVGI